MHQPHMRHGLPSNTHIQYAVMNLDCTHESCSMFYVYACRPLHSHDVASTLLTPPPCFHQVLQGTGATRVIANKLEHEEQQKPSQLPDELRHGDDHGANPPGPMSSEDKHVSETCYWLLHC
jgi:hypothetical protein